MITLIPLLDMFYGIVTREYPISDDANRRDELFTFAENFPLTFWGDLPKKFAAATLHSI